MKEDKKMIFRKSSFNNFIFRRYFQRQGEIMDDSMSNLNKFVSWLIAATKRIKKDAGVGPWKKKFLMIQPIFLLIILTTLIEDEGWMNEWNGSKIVLVHLILIRLSISFFLSFSTAAKNAKSFYLHKAY